MIIYYIKLVSIIRDAIIVFEIKKEIINLEKSHLKQVCSNTWETHQKCDVIAR